MYEAKCIVMDYQHHNAQLQAQTQQHLQQLQSLAPDSTRWNQYQQFWRHQMLMNGIKNIFIRITAMCQCSYIFITCIQYTYYTFTCTFIDYPARGYRIEFETICTTCSPANMQYIMSKTEFQCTCCSQPRYIHYILIEYS